MSLFILRGRSRMSKWTLFRPPPGSSIASILLRDELFSMFPPPPLFFLFELSDLFLAPPLPFLGPDTI